MSCIDQKAPNATLAHSAPFHAGLNTLQFKKFETNILLTVNIIESKDTEKALLIICLS